MENLMIVHILHSLKGGVATVALTLIKKQILDGFCVGVAYAINGDGFEELFDLQDSPNKPEMFKVEPSKYPGQNMLLGFNVYKIYRHYHEKHPDKNIVVHAHNVETIGLLGRTKGIPLLCTVHGTRGNEKNFRTIISDFLCKSVIRKIVKQQGFVVCVSNYVKTYWDVNKRHGLHVIYNGCIGNKGERKAHQGFYIGYIGDISYAKGIDILLEAIKQLPDDVKKDLKLIMAGREKDITINEIELFFNQNNINIKFEFLGYVSNASDAVNPKLDVFVLPSRNEGLSVCLIEAMSYGVPLIGTVAGGIPEIITDGVNGFLVGDAEQLSKKISAIYYDTKLAENLSSNGIRIFKDLFTADAMYNRYLELYLNLYLNTEEV